MTTGDCWQAYLRIWGVTVHDGGEGEHRSEDWELGVPLQTCLPGILPSPSMILKKISNFHYALLQWVCHDQLHMQKCYWHLHALEVISTPPDRDTFSKLIFELENFDLHCEILNK